MAARAARVVLAGAAWPPAIVSASRHASCSPASTAAALARCTLPAANRITGAGDGTLAGLKSQGSSMQEASHSRSALRGGARVAEG
jgi:hypothetical protein